MRIQLVICLVVLAPLPAWADGRAAAIVLGSRHGHGNPHQSGCGRTGGGNIHIVQPSPDIVVITMSGAVAATGHPFKDSHAALHFDLNQKFKIISTDPKKPIAAKLFMDVQVIGLLRSGANCETCLPQDCDGGAEHGQACASVQCGPQSLLALCVAPHAVGCRDKLSINCQEGPICAPIAPGCYSLHGTFNIRAFHKRSLIPCRPASAEFGAGALSQKWLGHWDPFRGAAKDDFGFRITLRVVATDVLIQEQAGAVVEGKETTQPVIDSK